MAYLGSSKLVLRLLSLFASPAWLRLGPAVVRAENQTIRLPTKGVNVRRALIQRSPDLLSCEDWQTMALEDGKSEAVDLTTGEPQYFYRAVEDTPAVTE